MLTIDDKKFIQGALNNMMSKIVNKPLFDFRLNHKSLYAWCIYQEFINEFLVNYISEDEFKKNDKIEEVYNILEIDDFSVSALEDLDTETKKIIEQIKKIKEKIGL